MVLQDEMLNETNSLTDCMSRAFEDGFTESFKVIGNKLTTEDEKYFYEAEEVDIDNMCSFESDKDGEEGTFYMLETADGRRGTLIDAYGPYADTKLAHFMRNVEEAKKKSVERGGKSWKEFLRGL